MQRYCDCGKEINGTSSCLDYKLVKYINSEIVYKECIHGIVVINKAKDEVKLVSK